MRCAAWSVRSSVLAVIAAVAASALANVTVPSFVSDHMVLQRDMPVAVWGWADPGEAVAVQLGDKPAVQATAGADRSWKVSLPATPAGGPFVLTIKGKNEIRIADVLVGEVWLCSGQSNMEMVVASCINSVPKDGYGSMQVHNHGAQQTVFAINHWGAGGGADLGIGNSQGETRDWTFKANAGSFAVKKLRVFVRVKK